MADHLFAFDLFAHGGNHTSIAQTLLRCDSTVKGQTGWEWRILQMGSKFVWGIREVSVGFSGVLDRTGGQPGHRSYLSAKLDVIRDDYGMEQSLNDCIEATENILSKWQNER